MLRPLYIFIVAFAKSGCRDWFSLVKLPTTTLHWNMYDQWNKLETRQ